METYRIQDLSFTYPGKQDWAIHDLSLTVPQGQFVTLCGPSGCGKTTLLRQLKTVLTPHGQSQGEVFFQGQALADYDFAAQAAAIGFVQQSPDNQIVTDKVWHELAFGLESLGLETPTIRLRTAEMASFFGIDEWFHRDVASLSGGQKQLLNLASTMAMQPGVLILDEPTSQLDPIAAAEFLTAVARLNRELGVTVLLSEHRLEEALPYSDRLLVLEAGRLIADGSPAAVGAQLKQLQHPMQLALPTPMRVYAAVENELPCPVNVREGRVWLEQIAAQQPLLPAPATDQAPAAGQPILSAQELWFRYEKETPDVVRGLSLELRRGELFALVGGNGSGKTTTLNLLSGLLTAQRGSLRIAGRELSSLRSADLYQGLLGVLPQNPQALFVEKTVKLDLLEMLRERKDLSPQEKQQRLADVARLCQITQLLEAHPYDLSGGEQQRAALAKVLLLEPQILLLDEPTKGMDAHFKRQFAAVLQSLQEGGVSILMVSHDIEFCARYTSRCALFADGALVGEAGPRAFFAGNSFYTTAANRMARQLLPQAVTAEDLILSCGGTVEAEQYQALPEWLRADNRQPPDGGGQPPNGAAAAAPRAKSRPRKFFGGLLLALGLIVATVIALYFQSWFAENMAENTRRLLPQTLTWQHGLAALLLALLVYLGLRLLRPCSQATAQEEGRTPPQERRLSRRTLAASLLILVLAPLTIWLGLYYLGSRKYYIVSLLVILEVLIPFLLVFEGRKPQARELILIAALCGLGVAGRIAFFWLPQFKPVMALVIIAAVAFGAETGFLVGAVTAFVSNFFFGQGPWTPWQMFAFGIIGFCAGILFRKGWLGRNRWALACYGFVATHLIYGGLMNASNVLMYQEAPTVGMFLLSFLIGVPFDFIHATATVVFLLLAAKPLLEKLDRVKRKYGLLES